MPGNGLDVVLLYNDLLYKDVGGRAEVVAILTPAVVGGLSSFKLQCLLMFDLLFINV